MSLNCWSVTHQSPQQSIHILVTVYYLNSIWRIAFPKSTEIYCLLYVNNLQASGHGRLDVYKKEILQT